MKSICVFCGSRPGSRPDYQAAAEALGRALAGVEIRLIYGGSGIGLMGALARAVLQGGGQVTGVIPRWLSERELPLAGLNDLRMVDSMHQRKALMAELSEGFIALPGGTGTLEEFVEVLTWAQLGIHGKPCGLLNICGYYDPLLGLLDHMVQEGFLTADHRDLVLVDSDPELLLMKMSLQGGAVPPPTELVLEDT